ncbi:MAG TPA: aroma-sacti cluster domain-containing protein [Streptosporangiaceae bacterium]
MDEHDPLQILADAGLPTDRLPPQQRDVLATLSPEEVELILALKERLDAAEPDVVAHSEWIGGAIW